MRKWMRRLALYSATVWAFVAIGSLYSVYLARATPQWYSPARLRENMANQSVQTAADLFSYASDVAAAQRRNYINPPPDSSGPAAAIAPKTITISEDQVNAFVTQWEASLGSRLGSGIGRYLSDGRAALMDGRLIVAGKLKDAGMLSDTIASIEFAPALDPQGNLRPNLTHVYGGRLPVPLRLLDKPRIRFSMALQDALPEWEVAAGVGPDGLANRDAAAVAAAKLILAALDDTETPAIFLIPCAVGDLRQTVPLQITALSITDRRLTVTVAPLTNQQLRGLLQDLSQQLTP